MGVARGGGRTKEQTNKEAHRKSEEKEAEQERSMGGNMNDLDSKKGERATAEVVRRMKGEEEGTGGGTSKSSCHCVGALQLKC